MASQFLCTSKSVDLLDHAQLQLKERDLGQETYYAGKRRILNAVATTAH
jgi:hypothetical protein